jgi:ATP-dependent protease ClpP protease subunit
MEKKNLKILTILVSSACLIFTIFLPIEEYLVKKSNDLVISLLADALIYWAVLLISGAILLSFLISNDGDFVSTIDLFDLASILLYACFIAYGINLVLSSSFKIANSKSLENFSGVAAIIINENWLSIDGPIGSLTLETVNQIANSTDIKFVQLNSGGGLIETALDIASFVDKNNISTVVNGECASACVLIAISGKQLLVSRSARFGFHNASSIGQPGSELGKYSSMMASKTMFSYLMRRGIPRDIIREAETTPANEMYYVNGVDFIQRGLAVQLAK